MRNNVLLSRFVGVPSLLAPEMRQRFEAALMAIMAHERHAELINTPHAEADDGFWFPADDWRAQFRPYVVRNGILFIPVKGVLLHDFPWALGSWATGYIYIARALARGLADPSVIGIALICDSYGGEVAGCFELVDKIYAARGTKPIRAFSHEFAYSAGYAVACAADSVAVSKTGGVGSIGVVCAHIDVSAAMEEFGIKITFIFAGKHKVDGNAYEPLPPDVKARLQSRIDELYDVFVASVARNRGMEERAIRKTEALTFTAGEAVSNGLADSIGPLDDAVAAFAADLSLADDEGEEEDMTETSPKPAATTQPANNDAAVSQARTEGLTAGRAEGATAGRAEGVTAERARISAILGCDEAVGRDAQARHLAFNTDMTPEAAKGILATAPKAAASDKKPSGFETAMGENKNPEVGAGDGEVDANDPVAIANNIVALHAGQKKTA